MKRIGLIGISLVFFFLPSRDGLAFTPPYNAIESFKGSISFTAEEKLRHEAGVERMATEASRCLQEHLDLHQSFYRANGISKYYGDASTFSKLSYANKRKYLQDRGLNPALVDQMLPTSCIGMTLSCMGLGFAAAEQSDLWKRVRAFTVLNNVTGDALQYALRQLGWKSLYWNPDPSQNAKWDLAEKRADPTNKSYFWGYHTIRYNQVMTKGKYLWNIIDDAVTLVNFKRKPPEKFKNAPFFVGTAHMGYHVFPGFFGRVVEAHSTRLITDYQTVESSDFNPLENGGAPRGNYWSGAMVVPPRSGF